MYPLREQQQKKLLRGLSRAKDVAVLSDAHPASLLAASEPIAYLLDDQPDVLRAMARLLAVMGIASMSFSSARDFLHTNREHARGCLVLDLAMPDMGGIALQQALAERNSSLPIVFLTGHCDVDSSLHTSSAGVIDVISKPVDAARLVDAVQAGFATNLQLLRLRRDREELASRSARLTPPDNAVAVAC